MKKTGRCGFPLLCASRKAFAAFLLFGLFQARGFMLPAEEAPPHPLETGPSFQRLRWNNVEFAAWYEVTLEAGEPVPGGAGLPSGDSGIAWHELLRERRELPGIDCSLAPGQYRYRVQAFDILGRGGEISEWIPFEVRSALGGGPVQRLSWTNVEFTAACVVVVERQEEEGPSAGAGERAVYREVLRELREQDAFIEVSLPPGKYRFRVGAYDALGRPGEVSGWEYFEIFAAAPEPEKPAPPSKESVPKDHKPKISRDSFVEVLYTPLIPLPFSYFNKTYDIFFQPAGAALKFGMLFPAGQRHALGFDLTPSWNYLYADKPGYDVLSQLLTLHFNLVYRYGFSTLPLTLQARAGGGLSLLYDFHFEYSGRRSDEVINTWIPSVSAGLSLQWFFHRPLYLNLGLEYLQIFSVDNLFLNFIRPSLGIGMAL
jgi:hypothetical protein